MGDAKRRLITQQDEIKHLKGILYDAHDLIHKEDIEAAHRKLHCGIDETEALAPSDQKAALVDFSSQFNALCIRMKIPACFVLFIPDPLPGEENKSACRHKIAIGGAREAEAKLRQLIHLPKSDEELARERELYLKQMAEKGF